MMYGTVAHWRAHKEMYPSVFSRALVFLERLHGEELEDGVYPIEGKDIFCIVQQQETAPEHTRRFELHRAYIDIQLLLAGREQQGYAPEPPLDAMPLENRLAADDVAFYPPPAYRNCVRLRPGDFAVYLPGELHCPNCVPDSEHPGPLRKLVFKIHRRFL